ncbi:hypothetical protein AX16_007381 [Volvariella volvacea WC 439]|nr:hypothetical protein AX16_007381 [Volvariella volvacea WC 439]
MFANNPYAQAGWTNAANPNAIQDPTWNTMVGVPPTFGALPNIGPNNTSILTLYFTQFNPNILNSTVIGPNNEPCYKVISAHGRTAIQRLKNDGRVVSTIEWNQPPMIEVDGIATCQEARKFLAASPDGRSRLLQARGKQYAWTPQPGNCICLFSVGSNQTTQMWARIADFNGGVRLEVVAGDGFGPNMVDAVVASTVLLKAGQSID